MGRFSERSHNRPGHCPRKAMVCFVVIRLDDVGGLFSPSCAHGKSERYGL